MGEIASREGLYKLFCNPPESDRREVVPFCEIGDLEGFARTYFSKEYS